MFSVVDRVAASPPYNLFSPQCMCIVPYIVLCVRLAEYLPYSYQSGSRCLLHRCRWDRRIRRSSWRILRGVRRRLRWVDRDPRRQPETTVGGFTSFIFPASGLWCSLYSDECYASAVFGTYDPLRCNKSILSYVYLSFCVLFVHVMYSSFCLDLCLIHWELCQWFMALFDVLRGSGNPMPFDGVA